MQDNSAPNPDTPLRRWRCGDVGPDGRVFWSRDKSAQGGLYWVSPELFRHKKAAARERHVAYYTRHRERLRAKYREVDRHSPVFVSARKAYRKRNKAKISEIEQQYKRRQLANDPGFRILVTLRSRLKLAVRAYATSGSSRAADKAAAAFLLWLAARVGADPMNGSDWHIDHLIPLSKLGELKSANAPENVRWLRAKENLARGNADPTPEEIAGHLALVEEWKKETKSQLAA